jgi:hypothetical protein
MGRTAQGDRTIIQNKKDPYADFPNWAKGDSYFEPATMGRTAQGDRTKIQNKIVDDQRAIEEVSATREVEQSEAAYPAIDARREAILGTPDSPGQIEAEPGLESAADGVEHGVIVTTGLEGEATKDEAATMNIEEAARNESLQTHPSSFISHPTPQPVELTAEEDASKIQNKPMKRKGTAASRGPRRDVRPTTKAPSKERRNEILDEWVANMLPETAKVLAGVRQREEKVRRRKEGRKRERADQKTRGSDFWPGSKAIHGG